MKFGKEYTAQMVPEWQQAYMDYNKLKAVLKDIQRFKQMRTPPSPAPAAGGSSLGLKRNMTMYRAFSGLTRRYSRGRSGGRGAAAEEQVILVNPVDREGAGSGKYETMFLMPSEEGGEYEIVFFRRLDDEFNKVNSFYGKKMKEVLTEADDLTKQMNALIAFRLRVENPNSFHSTVASPPTPSPTSPNIADVLPTQTRMGKPAHMDAIQEVEMSSEGDLRDISEESIVDVDEPENNTSVHETKSEPENKRSVHGTKANKKSSRLAPIEVLQHVKINIALETPRSTIKSMLMDAKYTEMRFSKEELRKVEEQLKQAFIEFYQKLRLLNSYSFLNLLAFSKIMKKYDKITSRSASRSYLNMVDNSYLGSSDEVTRLMVRVEATLIKHFANANRTKGMNFLRPKGKREKHRTAFFFGFAAGCSIALLVALALILIINRNIYVMLTSEVYMNTMFRLNSLFGFIVLHMLMYAANIYFWRRYRVNYPFIFGFKQGTDLGYRQVFLLGSSLAVLALAGVHATLDMEIDKNTGRYELITELVPLGLVTLVVLITICPFNIIYRSSRFFLLRCAFHCICAPLYKVTLPDFFLADQLTSQVQAIRDIEFYICYYGWGKITHREHSCGENGVYKTFLFIIAVIPYWFRFLQCMRRLVEEKDKWQGYNALKYFSTIVAVVMRTAYSQNKGKTSWLILAAISSTIATVVSTYWDIVIDWGLLQKNSKNRWLRDKLLVSHRSSYFAAMVLNVFLRFAWLQSVIGLELPFIPFGEMATTFACLEIIRRGIWNFFRIENEHLNNVGKYRAFKSVPLPFNYDTEGDHDE